MEPLAANDPRQIGAYRLQSLLGAGGMGRVYLGFSPAGRAVAVKVIHPAFARDPEFLRRFKREVLAAEAVGGAYTAPVVAAGPDDDPPWLATAFVPGPSLADVVAEAGPLPEPVLWRLAGGLIEALQAVHASGLVHRDLKPANVLLATDGPRVIDFGISRALEGTTTTATGMIVGTPGFLSPEQATGSPVGPATDVFALGSVIAFAATGGSPFGTGEPVAMAYRVVHAEPELRAIPIRLRDLVAGCLAKEPASRPSLNRLMDAVMAGSAAYPGLSPESFWPEPVASLVNSRRDSLRAEAPIGTPAPPAHGPTTSAVRVGQNNTNLIRAGGASPHAKRRGRIAAGTAAFVVGGLAAALIALFATSSPPESHASATPPSHSSLSSSSSSSGGIASSLPTPSPSSGGTASPSLSPSPSRSSSATASPTLAATTSTTALVCVEPAIGCSASNGVQSMQAKPSQVVISADGSGAVKNIAWSDWGTATATGAGILEVDNCNPNCATGTYKGYPARVTLTGLSAFVNGKKAYASMVVSAPASPYGNYAFNGLVPLSGGVAACHLSRVLTNTGELKGCADWCEPWLLSASFPARPRGLQSYR